MKPLLRAINISKSFGTLPAIQQVSFEVIPGEVVGLAGGSGAGKTVLAMILAGLHTPNKGHIYFEEQLLQYPFRARQLGIEVVNQQPILNENLDITSNIFLGHEICWPSVGKWLRIPNYWKMDKNATQILKQLGVHFPSLRKKVSNLSSEQKQLVAIAQVMIHPAKLILVDEPDPLLSYFYQKKMLSLIQCWQQQGTAVVFASKDLEHLFAVTDRIIVLRQGYQVADFRTDETTREEVVAALVGTPEREQLTPAIWALDSYYRAREQADQLHQKQMLLEQNLAAQDTLNQQLIEQLGKQVDALDQANIALQSAQRRLLTQREEERKHLSRELHDQIIQDLLGINYQIEDINTEKTKTPELEAELVDIHADIRGLVVAIRSICGELRPPTIDSLGLGAALQSYTRDWSKRLGISVNLELNPNLGRLPETIELSVFRIIQEGLNNVRRHAQAGMVDICLKHTSPRTLSVSISDNGTGLTADFDLSKTSAQGHFGLLGISERVALLGGNLNLKNQPDSGLRIEVEIPHPRVGSATNN